MSGCEVFWGVRETGLMEMSMQNVGLILLTFAFVFGCIATWFMESHPKMNFGWAAVTFWIAAELLGGLGKVFH